MRTISDLIPLVPFGVLGTVGAAATALDGYPLAKDGQAAPAFGAGYRASLIRRLFSALPLAIAIPVLRSMALYLDSPELLALCIFGLAMVVVLSGKAPLKGLGAAGLVLMLAMVGGNAQTGTLRSTFGTLYLWDPLPLVPFSLGIFAIPTLADMAIARTSVAQGGSRAAFDLAGQWRGLRDALESRWLVLRCSVLAAFLGAVLGRGAFLIHDLVPGPDMLSKHLDVTSSIIWALALAHVVGATICLSASALFARLAIIRASILVPLVLMLIFIGAFETSQSRGDLAPALRELTGLA